MAEIVRGGVISIDKGQFEAAQAIGMNHVQTMLMLYYHKLFEIFYLQQEINLLLILKIHPY